MKSSLLKYWNVYFSLEFFSSNLNVDGFFFFQPLAKLNYFQQPRCIKESDFPKLLRKHGRHSFLAQSQVQPSFSAFYRVS